jgi:hypothetical protein
MQLVSALGLRFFVCSNEGSGASQHETRASAGLVHRADVQMLAWPDPNVFDARISKTSDDQCRNRSDALKQARPLAHPGRDVVETKAVISGLAGDEFYRVMRDGGEPTPLVLGKWPVKGF